MTMLVIVGFAAFVLWVSVRSMNRDKAIREQAAAIRVRVREAHGIEDIFVSPANGSYVGLSGDGLRVVLRGPGEERLLPMCEVLAIEGVRDDVVLVRADRASDPDPPPVSDRTPADLPERIRWLGLRFLLKEGDEEDEEYVVLFFDGGKHGVEPVNAAFRRQAAETEAWFRRLTNAIRLAA